MASIILRSAGAAFGNALVPGIGGAFFGVLGRSVGGAVDGQLGLGTRVTGPRLENLSVQDSRYGAGIPIIYGNARVAGNVIWSTDMMQATQNQSIGGGKGGGVSATTYTYSVHCAVGIASGVIGGIGTIWADSTIIYQNGVWTSGIVDGASFYFGTTTQAPDPLMQSILGAANVPAYRGLAYVVFDNLQLQNFGNRLPNITFEVTPATTTSNPQWTGGVDVGINANTQAVSSGNITPIVLGGNATNASRVLVGGYVNPGASCKFSVAEYDVSGDIPVLGAAAQSAVFTTGTAATDCGWAMAPDNRFIAMFVQSTVAPYQKFVLYDSVNRTFGAVFSVSTNTVNPKQIGWIDAQHFIVDDIVSGVRGVHVFARAGMTIIDLGFFGVWGAASSTTRLPLFYTQYVPFAGGLINIMTDAASGGNYFTALYARTLSWQNNALVVGTAYAIASGLTSTGANEHANIVQTSTNEWTLCLGTAINFTLISFELSASSAVVTRPWQRITTSLSSGYVQCPLFYGDRLVMLQTSSSSNSFYLSEVLLGASSFTLNVNAVVVGNFASSPMSYGALPLDATRLLVFGLGGYINDIQQFGMIQRAANGQSLDSIAGDILTRSGYAASDYDVTALSGNTVRGFVLSEPMSARAAIEPLQVYTPFDLIESNGKLKAVLRHATADTPLPPNEWRAADEHKPQPPALQTTRAQELDLPLELNVDYIDPARNFEVNSQRARRVASHAKAAQKINLPIVANTSTAKQIAEARLYSLWAERELTRLSVSRTWAMLDPGDVIDLQNGTLLRIATMTNSGNLLGIEGFPVNSAVYASSAIADSGAAMAVVSSTGAVPSILYLMDLPLLQATDNQPGIYMAATGNAGWTSATVMRSADGVNYAQASSLSTAAIAGIAVTALGNGSALYMDKVSNVNVQIINGSLASCAYNDLLNGANAALLGSEILQFQTATLIGPGLYTLSNFLRGRRGTEAATASHATGENFILLQTGAVDFVPTLLTDRGATYDFRAVSKGQNLGDVLDTVCTYGLGSIQPFAPVNMSGVRVGAAGTDLTLTWQRRARMNADWVNYVDVPLDEPTELYDVEIMNGATVVRTFSSLTAPTVTYTAAMQTTDWGGSIPAHYTVNVYQISSRYGRGKQANAVV